MRWRPYIAAAAVLLLIVNLVFGKVRNGSQNWVMIGPVLFQPSELVKVAFIFFGTSTLQGIQTTKNLTGFILFSAVCMGALFIMGDFGTACIFFVTFILISFMRSGSIRTVILTCAAAGLGIALILKFKPYIVTRFLAWRHVWQYVNDIGYQQTRVLAYSASGGLIGLGIGKGCLKYVFAAPSDLIFGMLCEEWGLILALTSVMCIAFIGIYARSASLRSRSTFYSIASCCAAGMLVFQMMMNVFGVVDILPLTGVTLPFISLGGSSMISVWGLLAFVKSSDERTYAARL
jgi:cell division protein FtsW (lipid II flippase)